MLKQGENFASQSATHFFGSFVLAPFNISARSAATFLVVDGQQRLTTVFLLLAALRDMAAASDPGEHAHYQGVLVNGRARRDEDRPRLVPTQSDRAAFQAIIDGRPQDAGNSKIGEAYRFFVAQLAKEDEDGDPLDAERIQRVVLDRLAVVEITADRDDNPHRIFESLNARGEPLTQADLLRNYVFMLLPTRGEKLYHDVWLPMQEVLGPDHMVGLARVDLQRRGIDANIGDVYRLQQDRLSKFGNNEAALEGEVRDLALRAQYYRCFIEPTVEPDPALRASLERLQQWGAQTTYPLLMHLYGLRGEGKATTEQLRRALLFIESFLVRRQLVGVPAKQLNRLFANAVQQLSRDLPVDEALRELLSRERRYWPTDEQIRQAVRTRNFYFSGRGPQRMLILERLEQSFAHKEPVDLKAARPTIEHIMPQTLTEEWRQHLTDNGDDPSTVHAELLHTLGNLTLSSYNTELSNKVFERKQQMYSSSHFALNASLVESPNWACKEILARADDLARRIIAVWPGPLSSGAGAPEMTDWGRVDAAIALIPSDRTCTVNELAAIALTSPESLLARLRSRPVQHGLEHVLDGSGQPLRNLDVVPDKGHRAISAYELAQLMPFEFEDEELKVLRRRKPIREEKRQENVDNEHLRDDTRLKFWTLFVERAQARGSRFAVAQPQEANWIQKTAGMKGVRYNVVIRQHHTLVELYIDEGSRENNLRIFEELRNHQTEIEAAFGDALEWDVKPERRVALITREFETGGYVDSQSFTAIADALLDGFSRFEAALQPFIDVMAPERTAVPGRQVRDRPWTEEEYIAAIQATAPENVAPAQAILQWAHSDPRVTMEGGGGAQNAGIRLRTSRPDDKASAHSFLILYANTGDNVSAEVQFASMARREPFVARAKRVALLDELNAIATTPWGEDDVDMRVPFRLRDLRDSQHWEVFLNIWRRYLDTFHSDKATAANGDNESVNSVGDAGGAVVVG